MFIQIILLPFKEKYYYFIWEKRNPPFSLMLLEGIFRILEKAQFEDYKIPMPDVIQVA